MSECQMCGGTRKAEFTLAGDTRPRVVDCLMCCGGTAFSDNCVSRNNPKIKTTPVKPYAWAVTISGGRRFYDVYALEEHACAIAQVVTPTANVVPLYRAPSLSRDEREAIEEAIFTCEIAALHDEASGEDRAREEATASALKALLARLS